MNKKGKTGGRTILIYLERGSYITSFRYFKHMLKLLHTYFKKIHNKKHFYLKVEYIEISK